MNTQKLLFSFLLSFAIFGFSATGAMADTYGQANCTSTYGQAGCLGTSKEASKSAVYLADTALDTPSLFAAGALMMSGLGALVLKKKIA